MLASFVFTAALHLTGQFFNQPVAWNLPQRMTPRISQVYIPVGFDNNDVAQIIVEFEFKNSCEDLGNIQTVPHEDFPNVLLLYTEGFRKDDNCLQTTSHRIRPVDLGVLSEGVYEIRDYRNLEKMYGQLSIRKAGTAKIDSRNYAPVDSLIVHADEAGFRRLITLAGTFSNTCLEFVPEQMRIVKTGEKLIEVLPVIDKANRADCMEQETPFLETFKIPDRDDALAIRTGRYLIHVRTLNGQSFNKIDHITTPH